MAFENLVELVAADAVVPARLAALVLQLGEALLDVGKVGLGAVEVLADRFGDRVRGEAVQSEGEAVQSEVLGAALVEHPRDRAGDVVVARERLGRLVGKRGAGGDVEARLDAVARERCVRPFAVQPVGAEDEGAVDGGALGAVGRGRVAVLEAAVFGVARWQLDLSAVEVDGQAILANLSERPDLLR